MYDSKVVDAIRMLSTEERADFGLFLLSPYFHKGFSVAELKGFYEQILAALQEDDGLTLSKEGVHALLFSGKVYSEGRVDRLMFELNRLVNLFLITQHYHRTENETQQMLDLAAVLRHKGKVGRVEKQQQKLKKDLMENQAESSDLYFLKYLVTHEEHEWQSIYNKVKDDLGLPEVITNLDLFYFTKRLEMLNTFLLQQRATSLEIQPVIKLALESPPAPRFYLDQSPVLLIAEKIHQLLLQTNPGMSGFQELMTLLQQYEKRLSPDVLHQFYTYLRNFCTFLIDSGNTELERVLHPLHQDNLKRGYFYYEGMIHPNAILNITQFAIRVKNLDWARSFIQEHKDKIIGENETHDFYRMNQALCLFAEKQLEQALDAIPFGSTNSSYHLMARRLELKIYYELDSELLPSKLEAFRMYVRRAGSTTFSPNLLELYTNFGNLIHQLILSIPGDKKRSTQLVSRIQAKKLVAERSWLLEKARELGESKKK